MSFVEKRVSNFRSVLSTRGLDVVLLANFHAYEPNHHDYNLYYASNLLGYFPLCFLLLTEHECGFWVEAEDVERARKQSGVKRIEPMELKQKYHSPREFTEAIAKHLKELVGRETIKLGVDGRYLPSSVTLSLLDRGLKIEDVSLDLERSRLVKDEEELKLLRKAAEIADKGVEKVMKVVHEGVTERELSVLAEHEMRRSGAECFWWPSIISSGPEAEAWADSPSERRIMKGDLLWMDFTPVYMGYGGDIARSFVYGAANEKQLKVFNLAEKVLDEAASTLRNDVTVGELMEAAAQLVKGSPYERFYAGTGHGIGLYNDIYPVFLTSILGMNALPSWLLGMKLIKGMTVAIEIIFTVPGLGGVRLEDDYIVTVNQPERLTKAPITATLTS